MCFFNLIKLGMKDKFLLSDIFKYVNIQLNTYTYDFSYHSIIFLLFWVAHKVQDEHRI